MDYRAEKPKNNKKQFIHTLKNHLDSLNKDNSFFRYSFKISFLVDRLIVLLIQDKTGLALQMHVVIEDNGRSSVEHFTLYEDPALATLNRCFTNVGLTSIILQGLNFLFFWAANQQLTSLPFYLWHEEADHLVVVKSFFKERLPTGNYVRLKMPTKASDYNTFIEVTKKSLARLHEKLWRIRNNNQHMKLFLKTRRAT